MISADVDECSKSLQEYQVEVERKLKYMVAAFAGSIAEAASDATRRGDVSSPDSTAKYIKYYQTRSKPMPLGFGIKAVEGFHQGAWVYSEGALTFDPTIYPVGIMKQEAEYQAQTNYQIGDSFVIGAVGPAYEMLQEQDFLVENATEVIMTAHRADLPRYYNEG